MKFRKRPVVVEAVRFVKPYKQVKKFAPELNFCKDYGRVSCVFIKTLEGVMRADVGDWIIRGVNGEFYPCKPDIFEKTYEAVG
jgi:hypothetical protein